MCTPVLSSGSLSLRDVWSSKLFKHFWQPSWHFCTEYLQGILDLDYIEQACFGTVIIQENYKNEVHVLIS